MCFVCSMVSYIWQRKLLAIMIKRQVTSFSLSVFFLLPHFLQQTIGKYRKQASKHFASVYLFTSYICRSKLLAKNVHRTATTLSVYLASTYNGENCLQKKGTGKQPLCLCLLILLLYLLEESFGNNKKQASDHSVCVCSLCFYICWSKQSEK